VAVASSKMRNRSRDRQFGYSAYALISTLVIIQRSNEWTGEDPSERIDRAEDEGEESGAHFRGKALRPQAWR
jgi:hypothetical protein